MQIGAYEVGVDRLFVYEAEKKAGKVDESKVAVIWETPTFPDYQFTVRGDVDSHLRRRLQSEADRCDPVAGRQGTARLFRAQQVHSGLNEEYKPIEVVARAANLLN